MFDSSSDWHATPTLRIARPDRMQAYLDLPAGEGPRLSALMNLAFAGYSLAAPGAGRVPIEPPALWPDVAPVPLAPPSPTRVAAVQVTVLPVPIAGLPSVLPAGVDRHGASSLSPVRLAPSARASISPAADLPASAVSAAPVERASEAPRATAQLQPASSTIEDIATFPRPFADEVPAAPPLAAATTPDGESPDAGKTLAVTNAADPAPVNTPRQTADGVAFQVNASLNGRTLGRVALLLPDSLMGRTDRVSEDIYVRLGDILDVLQQKLDPDKFQWLRTSQAAQQYVTLNDLRAHGIAVHFDSHDALAFKVR